jgi:ribonuclease HI
MIKYLYTDGSTPLKNPSPVGITYAFLVVDTSGIVIHEESGHLKTKDCGTYLASNNLAEMIAAVKALEYVAENIKEADEKVTLCTDSELTAFRMFRGYSIAKLPKNVCSRLGTAFASIEEAGITLDFQLLAGHPTRADLAQGYKEKKGRQLPVSLYNVRVDKMCKDESKLLTSNETDKQ